MAIQVRGITRSIFIFCLFSAATIAHGQTTLYGGRGLTRVFSAEPIGRSQFFVSSFFQTYLDPSKRPGTQGKASLGKDHTLTLGFTLGLTHGVEMTLMAVPYQDDQDHVWGPPGDTQVGLKVAMPFSALGVSTGVRGFFTFPTAKNANVQYEPYSSGNVAAGMMAMTTLDMTESFPLAPLKVYFNFGYLDHTLSDAFFAGEEDQYLLGAGLKFPIRSLVFYTEYTGEIFANHEGLAYGENSTRITQGVKFLGPWDMILDFAFDVGLDKPVKPASDPLFQKDYADWKLIFGMNYQVPLRREDSAEKGKRRLREDKEAARELEMIRTNREGAHESLQEMEKSLDEKQDTEKKEGEEKSPDDDKRSSEEEPPQ